MKQETLKRLKALSPNKIEKKFESKALGSTLEMSIYGDIEPDGYDWWTGETIESETSARHFKEVLDANPNATEIKLSINSMGGYVSEGIAIYSLLKRHKANVHVYVDGFACSMASAIAMAGDTVTMGSTAMMMIHDPWIATAGNATELRKVADDLDKQGEAFRQAYLDKAQDKLSEEHLVEMLDAETFLTAKECLAYGLCDEVESTEKAELTQARAEIASLKAEIENLKAQAKAPEPLQAKKPEEKPSDSKGWLF